jgi:hypothetical protein
MTREEEMSLLFAYKQVKILRPAVSLGGRLTRPRPLRLVTLIGPGGGRVQEALLDSGADETVFHDSVAAVLGLDLSGAPTGSAVGVASTSATTRYAQITLRLTDGREFCEWQGWVGFTSAPLRQPLLGFAGCLQFFHADFRGDREEVELVTNSLYAGRSGAFSS